MSGANSILGISGAGGGPASVNALQASGRLGSGLSRAASRLSEGHVAADDVRRALGEFVGGVFIEPVIKDAMKGPFHTEYFDGGRGEEVFAGQLAGELGKRIGRAMANDFGAQLVDAVARRVTAGA